MCKYCNCRSLLKPYISDIHMRRILRKVLLNKKKSDKNEYLIDIIFLIVGLYFSYILWYLVKESNLLSIIKLDMITLAGTFNIIVAFVLSMLKYPKLLFFNNIVSELFFHPIRPKTILILSLQYNTIIQLGITLVIFLPLFLISNYSKYVLIMGLAFHILLVFIINLVVLNTIIIVGKLTPRKLTGYFLILLQYIPILGTAVLIRIILVNFNELRNLNWMLDMLKNNSIIFYLLAVVLLVICLIIMLKLYDHMYERTYYKVSSFKLSRKLIRDNKFIKIHNAYIFLEIKQILRNKELLFNAIIRSILVTVVLTKLLLGKLTYWNPQLDVYSWIIIIAIIAAMNSISVTAYSRDIISLEVYRLLPVDMQKVFHSKVVISFLINQILILIYIIYEVISQATGILQLFCYATSINYVCSWIGVLLDRDNLNYKSNTNELLHGKFSRICVMLFALVKVIIDIKLIDYVGIVMLIGFNFLIISAMLIYTFMFIERGNYDRG